MTRPDLSRIPVPYHRYVNKVKEDDLNTAFRNQTEPFIRFLASIPKEKRGYRYAEGKWTIQEMLQHILDAERVFAYRSLCFARKDPNALPSFDENEYAETSNAAARNWDDMVEEFKAIRRSTELMFASFNEEQLNATGIASNNPVYVLGLGYTIAGHLNHHLQILHERYLETATA